jgi:hypothetical protein
VASCIEVFSDDLVQQLGDAAIRVASDLLEPGLGLGRDPPRINFSFPKHALQCIAPCQTGQYSRTVLSMIGRSAGHLVLTFIITVAFGRRCIASPHRANNARRGPRPAGGVAPPLNMARYSRSSRLATGAPRRPRCVTGIMKGSTQVASRPTPSASATRLM